MSIETEMDLICLKRIGKIVSLAREEMVKAVKPGITTLELDKIGERVLLEYGAKSAPKQDYQFPGATCISLNNEAAHGIPSNRILIEGDSVNIDVSAVLDGYYADTGATIVVGNDIQQRALLCECAKTALQKAIEIVRSGIKINQIGKVIYNEARSNGFNVIKNLTGHGIGRKLHEEPENILNYYDYRDNRILKSGHVLAIETFISTGADYVIEDRNGWTLITPDKSAVAQFEHTIVVTENEPIVLTL